MLASSRTLRSPVLLGLIITLLLAIVHGLEPKDLGVHVDDDLAREPRFFFVYISVIKFKEGTTLTDGNIVKLAQMGHQAMKDSFPDDQKKYPGLARSRAFTVLIKDNYAYLSSTIRYGKAGELGRSLLYSEPQDPKANWGVRKELIRCQIEQQLSEEQHRALANCAEPMAINLYQNFNQKEFQPKLSGAKIVTWGNLRQQKTEGVMRPCMAEKEPLEDSWGCQQFVELLLLDIIGEDTEPEDLPADLELEVLPYCNLPENQAGPS